MKLKFIANLYDKLFKAARFQFLKLSKSNFEKIENKKQNSIIYD